MTRKGAAALLAVLIALYFLPLCVRAEDPPSITVIGGTAAPGGTAEAEVYISGNPGIYSFSLGFEYDETRLELTGASVEPALGGQSVYSKRVVWISGSEDVSYNGRILVLTFAVKKDALPGGAAVTVSCAPGDICNLSEENIDFTVVPGEITVTGSGEVIYDADRPELADPSELCVRLAGNDRIQTAVAVSGSGWTSSEYAIIANAFNYPDALAGASLSKLYDAPILLNDFKSLDGSVTAELERLGADKIIILGGTAAVSEDVENALAASGASVSRLYGSNRNGTAAAIAKELPGTGTAYLVSNSNFADALSVSPAAAVDGAPILYMNPDGSVPAETADVLNSAGCSEAFIIGGTAAVAPAAEDNLIAMGIKPERIYGSDRYLTSLAVCERFGNKFGSGKAALATGKNFPDALSGAAFAARYDMPVILVGDSVPDQLKDYISEKQLGSLYAFGGTGALSDEVISLLLPYLKTDRTAAGYGGQQSDSPGRLSSCAGNNYF